MVLINWLEFTSLFSAYNIHFISQLTTVYLSRHTFEAANGNLQNGNLSINIRATTAATTTTQYDKSKSIMRRFQTKHVEKRKRFTYLYTL